MFATMTDGKRVDAPRAGTEDCFTAVAACRFRRAASENPPLYSRSILPEHVAAMRQVSVNDTRSPFHKSKPSPIRRLTFGSVAKQITNASRRPVLRTVVRGRMPCPVPILLWHETLLISALLMTSTKILVSASCSLAALPSFSDSPRAPQTNNQLLESREVLTCYHRLQH